MCITAYFNQIRYEHSYHKNKAPFRAPCFYCLMFEMKNRVALATLKARTKNRIVIDKVGASVFDIPSPKVPFRAPYFYRLMLEMKNRVALATLKACVTLCSYTYSKLWTQACSISRHQRCPFGHLVFIAVCPLLPSL